MILRTDLFRPWPILRAIREIELLQSQGKDITVVSWIKESESKLPQRENVKNIQVRRIFLVPPKSKIMRFPAFLKVNKLLANDAMETRIDAIIVHDLEVLRAGVLMKKKLRVPLLYHAHEDWPAMVSERSRLEAKIFSFLEKRYCKRIDHVYVPSKGIGTKYRKWGLNVTVQYASKSLSDMPKMTFNKKEVMLESYGFRKDDFILGLAGSLGRSEALQNIFKALKELPIDVKLLIVGGLEEKVKDARKLAIAEGGSERVQLTGFLDKASYMEHVGILDVGLALFIGKTLNVIQVAPIKLFDYMAMGIPIIASDLPGMRGIIEESGCGLLTDSTDPQLIALAIKKLYADKKYRERLSIAAKQVFISKFCWEKQQILLKKSHKIFQ